MFIKVVLANSACKLQFQEQFHWKWAIIQESFKLYVPEVNLFKMFIKTLISTFCNCFDTCCKCCSCPVYFQLSIKVCCQNGSLRVLRIQFYHVQTEELWVKLKNDVQTNLSSSRTMFKQTCRSHVQVLSNNVLDVSHNALDGK